MATAEVCVPTDDLINDGKPFKCLGCGQLLGRSWAKALRTLTGESAFFHRTVITCVGCGKDRVWYPGPKKAKK